MGQRLGFPIRGVAAPLHTYCRWEGDNGLRFNIETTSSRGMTFPADEEILAWEKNACPDSWKKHLFKPMDARALLGHFLLLRSDYYSAKKYYCHAVVDLHNALLLYPKNPVMKQNLAAYGNLQIVDREYTENDALRSLRPRMPMWKSLVNR